MLRDLVVGYGAGDAASDCSDGRAFAGVAIACVVADSGASGPANSSARQRPAGAEGEEGSDNGRSDNSFHVRHDVVSSFSPGDNALKLGPFRFETSMNQGRNTTVPAVQRERSFHGAPGALNDP
jgi:hypothetical protein